MNRNLSHELVPAHKEWTYFLLLLFVKLPIFFLLLICAYGFLVWFGQVFFWGPPT